MNDVVPLTRLESNKESATSTGNRVQSQLLLFAIRLADNSKLLVRSVLLLIVHRLLQQLINFGIDDRGKIAQAFQRCGDF